MPLMMSLTQEHNSMTHQSFEPPSLEQDSMQYANLLPRVLYHLIQENSQHLAKATFTSDGSDSLLTCLIC